MNDDQYDAYNKLVGVACIHGGEKARHVVLEFTSGSTIEAHRKLVEDLTEMLKQREEFKES